MSIRIRLDNLVNHLIDKIEKRAQFIDYKIFIEHFLSEKLIEQYFLDSKNYLESKNPSVFLQNLSDKRLLFLQEFSRILLSSPDSLPILDESSVMRTIQNKLNNQLPLTLKDSLYLAVLLENIENIDTHSLDYIMEKLLLRYEVRKKVYEKENVKILVLLSNNFMRFFSIDMDWRFFNTSMKINDMLYRIFRRKRINLQVALNKIIFVLYLSNLLYQEHWLSKLESGCVLE